MNKLRQPMSEGSFCVSGTHKVCFSPANGTIVDIMSIRSAIIFDNTMHRPTIVGRETERKLFIDRYCTSRIGWTFTTCDT